MVIIKLPLSPCCLFTCDVLSCLSVRLLAVTGCLAASFVVV